jgi:2-oxoisovalerate dehydrogenase E1 component alpha subunit
MTDSIESGAVMDGQGRNLPPLQLHVPEPPARPGESADFTHFDIPAADAAPRPDEATHPSQMRDFAYGLVRVLDARASARCPSAPPLPRHRGQSRWKRA